MKLYIIRHGETVENSNNCLVGRINSSLTQNGINQAKEVKKYLDSKNIDLIVSSTLDRCKQTAEIIAENKIDIIYTDKLLGRDHGEFTGKHRDTVDFNEYWNYNLNKQYETAENIRDLYDRCASVIEELKTKYNKKDVAIVTHSGVIRVLYYYFKGIPQDGIMGAIKIENCQVFEYEIGEKI